MNKSARKVKVARAVYNLMAMTGDEDPPPYDEARKQDKDDADFIAKNLIDLHDALFAGGKS